MGEVCRAPAEEQAPQGVIPEAACGCPGPIRAAPGPGGETAPTFCLIGCSWVPDKRSALSGVTREIRRPYFPVSSFTSAVWPYTLVSASVAAEVATTTVRLIDPS